MNLAFWDTARASTPRPEQPGTGGQHVLHQCNPASPGDRESSGADSACGARAPSLRERWRLPTSITERELWHAAGLPYGEATHDSL